MHKRLFLLTDTVSANKGVNQAGFHQWKLQSFETHFLSAPHIGFIQQITSTRVEVNIIKAYSSKKIQFIRRTKEAATQATCAGNTRGYNSEYRN